MITERPRSLIRSSGISGLTSLGMGFLGFALGRGDWSALVWLVLVGLSGTHGLLEYLLNRRPSVPAQSGELAEFADSSSDPPPGKPLWITLALLSVTGLMPAVGFLLALSTLKGFPWFVLVIAFLLSAGIAAASILRRAAQTDLTVPAHVVVVEQSATSGYFRVVSVILAVALALILWLAIEPGLAMQYRLMGAGLPGFILVFSAASLADPRHDRGSARSIRLSELAVVVFIVFNLVLVLLTI